MIKLSSLRRLELTIAVRQPDSNFVFPADCVPIRSVACGIADRARDRRSVQVGLFLGQQPSVAFALQIEFGRFSRSDRLGCLWNAARTNDGTDGQINLIFEVTKLFDRQLLQLSVVHDPYLLAALGWHAASGLRHA